MSELSVGSLSGLAANSYVIDVASGSSLDLSSGAVLPAGSILQVVSTTKTDAFTTTSGTYVDVTGLSATITPTSASSKILVIGNVTIGGNFWNARPLVRLDRNGTDIALSTAASVNNGTVGARSYYVGPSDSNQFMFSSGFSHLDSPATTSAIIYKFKYVSEGANAIYINRNGADSMGGVSSITLMEVAA